MEFIVDIPWNLQRYVSSIYLSTSSSFKELNPFLKEYIVDISRTKILLYHLFVNNQPL